MAIAIGLLKTLLELAEAKKTGALDAQGPSARVRFFLERGQIVSAEEGGVGETLGRILLRENVLDDDQYASAIEWMAEAVSQGKTVKLGEVLLQLKMITKQQLEAALSAQVRQKVIRSLSWTTARATFVECIGALQIDGRYPTPLEPLVLAALRNADPTSIDQLFAQSRTRFVSLRGDRTAGGGSARMKTIARLAAFQMPKSEDSLARSLDGSRTVAEIMLADGATALAALLLTDCLDLHPYAQGPRLERRKSSGNQPAVNVPIPKPPPPRSVPRPSKRPPSSLFGFEQLEPPTVPRVSKLPAAPTRTSQQIRAVSMRPRAPEEKKKVRAVTTKLKASREAKKRPPPMPDSMPMTPATPQVPLAPMARLLAEKAFQSGKKHLRANAMQQAADEMRRAAQLYAAPEYQLWAAWALLRSQPLNEMKLAPDLQEAAERALDDDAELGFAWYALGWIAKKNGEHGRAAELFERARVLDPESLDLAADVRLKLATPQAFVVPSRSLTGLPAVTPPPKPEVTRGELVALAPPMSTPRPVDVAPSSSKMEAAPQTPRVMPAPPPIGAFVEGGRVVPPAESTPRSLDDSGRPISSPRNPPPLPPSSTRMPAAAPHGPSHPSSARMVAAPSSSGMIAAPPSSARIPVAEPPPSSRHSFEPPSSERESSGSGRGAMIGAALVMAIAIGAGVLWLRRPAPRTDVPIVVPSSQPSVNVTATPESPPSASVTTPVTDASATADASATVALDVDASSSLIAPDAAQPDTTASADAGEIPTGQGALDFPAGAAGHRVFVDGRVVGEPPAPIYVSCGPHQIKVGSRGIEHPVTVPCGAHVAAPYP